GRVDLVGDAGREVADGLDAVDAAQLLLELLLLRDVAADPGHPEGAAVFVTDLESPVADPADRAVRAGDAILDVAQRIALAAHGERHVGVDDVAILRKDGRHEAGRVAAVAAPDLLVRRAQVDQLLAVGADHEEDLAHALRHLAEPLLTLP